MDTMEKISTLSEGKSTELCKVIPGVTTEPLKATVLSVGESGEKTIRLSFFGINVGTFVCQGSDAIEVGVV